MEFNKNRTQVRMRSIWAKSVLLVSASIATAASYADATNGNWGSIIPWPHVAVSAASMPDGRILTWASNEKTSFPVAAQYTHAALYSPSNGSFQTVDNPQHDMFCAGISRLHDGNILASGGNPQLQITSEFNLLTTTWSAAPLMNRDRWYGTNLTLPQRRSVQYVC